MLQRAGLAGAYKLDGSDYDRRFWAADGPPTTGPGPRAPRASPYGALQGEGGEGGISARLLTVARRAACPRPVPRAGSAESNAIWPQPGPGCG